MLENILQKLGICKYPPMDDYYQPPNPPLSYNMTIFHQRTLISTPAYFIFQSVYFEKYDAISFRLAAIP